MNPFLYAVEQPAAAFADLALICAFVAGMVVLVYALYGNVVELYEGYHTGGWDVNPPFSWVVRLAAVPAALAIESWLVSAMFSMLG